MLNFTDESQLLYFFTVVGRLKTHVEQREMKIDKFVFFVLHTLTKSIYTEHVSVAFLA